MAAAGFSSNAELSGEFFDDSELVQSLVNRALQGEEEFTVRPAAALPAGRACGTADCLARGRKWQKPVVCENHFVPRVGSVESLNA